MELVKPGVYEAQIVNYGIGQDRQGNPQAVVKFGFIDDEGNRRTQIWTGSFGGQWTKWTLKTLVVCGLKGNIEDLADGARSGILDTEAPVFVTIEHTPSKDGKKTFVNIKAVSKTELGIATQMNKEQAREQLYNLGVNQELEMLLSGGVESDLPV